MMGAEQSPNLSQIQKAKGSVCFLYSRALNGSYDVLGTGFFLGELIAGNQYAIYLVTAKHVLMNKDSSLLKEVFVRFNKKDGTTAHERVTLEGDFKIFMHTDPDVDIALFRCTPNQAKYEYTFIDSETIPTNKHLSERHIAEGTLAFMVGLFSPYIGKTKDQPFARYGRISLIPDEKVPIQDKDGEMQMINAYFFECMSFSGNSGSPVFFAFERVDNLGRVRYDEPDLFLAGVVKGHYPDLIKKGLVKDERDVYYQLNAGISVISPSFQLREILDQEELVKSREALKQEALEKTKTTDTQQ